MTSVVWIIMTSVVWIAAPLPDSRPVRLSLKFAPWDRPDDVLNDRVLLCPPLVDGKILWPDWLYEGATEAGGDLLQSLPLAISGHTHTHKHRDTHTDRQTETHTHTE